MAKKIPEINASSTADIAFLLLIFFLVATTMNVDSGIRRQLPPMPEENENEAVDVNRRNVLHVFVNAAGEILVGGRIMEISGLKDAVKEFILNPTNDPNKPERVATEIENLGMYPVSRGVVSLQNDRGTRYNTYIMVQNELTRAFNEMREDLSMTMYGKPFNKLGEAEAKAIGEAIPMKVSEAEVKDYLGGQ